MTAVRYLLVLLRALMSLCWCGAAAATAAIAATQPAALTLDPVLFGLAAVISTLAAGSTLSIRMYALFTSAPDKPLVKPWLFVTAHMTGSWMAAVVAFLLSKSNDWDVWKLLLMVAVFSFVGAKAVEMLAERMLGSMKLPTDPTPKTEGGAS